MTVDMSDYVKKMCKEFPVSLDKKVAGPWTEKLFKIDPKAAKLDPERKGIFHSYVMRAMFVCKRPRQDLLLGVLFFATRTRDPDVSDWTKFVRFMTHLKQTENDVLTLEIDGSEKAKTYMDAAFAVHADMKSQSGSVATLGKGGFKMTCIFL